MKKRYLQVRVQRAAEKQSCLSDSEMRLKLEHARNELILRLRGNDQTISTLKRRIQRKHLQRIALESLSHQAHLQKELIYSSNERLAHFFETEPCRNEDIPPPSLIVILFNVRICLYL